MSFCNCLEFEIEIVRKAERSMRVLTCILIYSRSSDLKLGFVPMRYLGYNVQGKLHLLLPRTSTSYIKPCERKKEARTPWIPDIVPPPWVSPPGPHPNRLSCVFKNPMRGDVGSSNPTVRPNLRLKSTPQSNPDPALDASTVWRGGRTSVHFSGRKKMGRINVLRDRDLREMG